LRLASQYVKTPQLPNCMASHAEQLAACTVANWHEI